MTQCIVVDRVPIASNEGTYQKQECRLWLVKIGDQLIYQTESISGFDHDLGLGMERLLVRSIQIVEDGLQ